MKARKHRHKESFSVLLISNTGQNTRHFHVTRAFMRVFLVFVLCVCVAFGWLMYQYLSVNEITSNYVNASEVTKETGTEETELLNQIAAQEALVQQLEEEIDDLNRRNNELTSENKALLEVAKTTKDAESADRTDDNGDNPEADPAYPSRYPYSETGVVFEKYSERHPYVSIDTEVEGDVVAAGDGTIAVIGSDDTYPLIIEIEHGNGYRTRYMLLQDVVPLQEEGTRVQSGTALVSVNAQNVQLDYQVIYEDKPIDPLIVFEAKG